MWGSGGPVYSGGFARPPAVVPPSAPMVRPAFGLGGFAKVRPPNPAALARKWDQVTEEVPEPFQVVPQPYTNRGQRDYRPGDLIPGTLVSGTLPAEGWIWVSHMSPEEIKRL